MECDRCKITIPKNALFCPDCGQKVIIEKKPKKQETGIPIKFIGWVVAIALIIFISVVLLILEVTK